MHSLDWNNLRYFLAVARAGTLVGAARSLQVRHSTVGRRIEALEATLGVTLFTHTPAGCVITEAGREIVPLAEEAERAVVAVERRVAGGDQRVDGIVRVTTSEGFSGFLVRRLAELRTQYPTLVVDVLTSNASLDIARQEADLAIRFVETTQADLICKRLTDVGWSLFASAGYLGRAGAPAAPAVYPKFDDLSNVPSGKDNPMGYRFVEFPIYNVLQGGLFVIFHHFTLEQWGRLVTIFATLFSGLFICLLMKKFANPVAAFIAVFFYLFLPYSIYYGRTILPDELMVTTTLGGLYFFSVWTNLAPKSLFKNIAIFIITVFFFACALLLKPFSAFFFLPAIWLAWKKWNWKFILNPWLWVLPVLSFAPFIWWRIWISSHPEGIPASNWLFNEGNIRFTGAFFHWLFAVRIGELILGFWGLAILVVGIISKKINSGFFYFFILSSIAYLCVVARGNVQHDYYQIPIIPTIAMFLGLGSKFVLFPSKESVSKIAAWSCFAVCVAFLFAFSWFDIRDFFNINNPAIVIAGQAVDSLTPKNAKVLAPYDGDTSFLYQTKRKGWASFEKSLPELITMGANYLVLVNPKPEDLNIGKTYKIVSSTKDYVLFNLNKKP